MPYVDVDGGKLYYEDVGEGAEVERRQIESKVLKRRALEFTSGCFA